LNTKTILSRNLLILSFVSLLNDFSTDMVFPLLPTFLAILGGGAVIIGIIEGLAESIAAFLRYLSGRMSDRFGRRKALAATGYGLSAVAKIFYAGAAHWTHVVAVRATDRIGKGFREAPRDAILAESVPRAHWGFGFGFHRMMDTSGALLGPLACLILIHVIGTSEADLRLIFLIAAIPGLLGLLLFFAVRETGAGRAPVKGDYRFIPSIAVRGPLAKYLAITILFTIGHLSIAFFVLRATELGLPLESIIFLYIWYNAAEAVGSLPVGRLTDRIGRRPILTAAYATFALTFGLAAVSDLDGWWSLLPFFVLVGIARALREGQGRAFVAELTPGALRATGFGSYHATVGLLALPAGYLAGRLWEIDFHLTFAVAAIACTLALIGFYVLWKGGGFDRRVDDAAQNQQAA
jgi:MFS family permease